MRRLRRDWEDMSQSNLGKRGIGEHLRENRWVGRLELDDGGECGRRRIRLLSLRKLN
jgi:hypothetical protein